MYDYIQGRVLERLSVEELLKNLDRMANSDEFKTGFGRESIFNFMEDIKSTLVTKSKIIKSLKYSISKATKVRFLIEIFIIKFFIIFRLIMIL